MPGSGDGQRVHPRCFYLEWWVNHGHVEAQGLRDEQGQLVVGDVGLGLHHAYQAEQEQSERLRHQLDLYGAVGHVLGHDVDLDARDDLADGLRGELVAQAQLVECPKRGRPFARKNGDGAINSLINLTK